MVGGQRSKPATGTTCVLACILVAATSLLGCSCCTWDVGPVDYEPVAGADWPVSTPEEEGLDRKLLDTVYSDASELETLYSLLVIKNGYLIAEAYFNEGSIDRVGPRQSITKSVTSALVGIAIEAGQINGTDARMVDYFPEFAGAIDDPQKRELTIEQLLQMRGGYPNEEEHPHYLAELFFAGDYHWVEHLVDFPLLSAPGSEFQYSNLTSHLLGAIVQRATGRDLKSYGEEHLFTRIGGEIPTWSVDSDGYTMGCIEIHLTARDMAKFGMLYMNGGQFDGVQVIPAWWVDASLERYSQNITMGGWLTSRYGDFYDVGYGYQWWSARAGAHEFDYACGHGANYIILLHELDTIIVTTADPLKGAELAGGGGWKYEGPINETVARFIRSLPAE